ncbi:MAG: hypothetical protein CUN55_00580 [Phototrophicales bacterium]|nr:MAG: hypothetical protein CUN55_00580 [Phototrophicales bacterium]
MIVGIGIASVEEIMNRLGYDRETSTNMRTIGQLLIGAGIITIIHDENGNMQNGDPAKNEPNNQTE